MTLSPPRSADMNWFAVLAHHATRTPDKAITVFEGETTTYGEMAAARGRAGSGHGGARRRSRRRRGSPLLQLSGVPRGGVRRQLPRCDRDADQLAAGRARGALHPRALARPRPRVRRNAGRGRRRGDQGDGGLAHSHLRLGIRAPWLAPAHRGASEVGRTRRRCARPATTSIGSCTPRGPPGARRAS